MNLILSSLILLISSDVMAADLMGDYLDQKYCCEGNAESSYDGFWIGPFLWVPMLIAALIYWKAPEGKKILGTTVALIPILGVMIDSESYVAAGIMALFAVGVTIDGLK